MDKSASRILADNLATLLRIGPHYHLPGNQSELARASGVAQKTISNWLRADWSTTPNLRKLEAVARVYGLALWQILMPGLTDDLTAAHRLGKLVDNYRHIERPAAQRYLERIAEAEAMYDTEPPK